MPYQNISAELSDAALAQIQQKITEIKALLPFLIQLTPEERQTLPKMGPASLAFVGKALSYAEGNPALVPPYVNVAEQRKDFALTEKLVLVNQQLGPLADGLESTLMAAGSEAFVTSLAFYNSVKQAAKGNVPGAGAIYNDLKTRFPGAGGKTATPPSHPQS